MDTNFGQHGLSCEDCGNRLVTDGFETWCSDGCGLVVDAQAFDNPGYRTDDSGRVVGLQHGDPQTAGFGAVGSMISRGSRDASGAMIGGNPEGAARLFRMRRTQRTYGKTAEARSTGDMSRVLNAIASRLSLGQPVCNRALELARKMKSRGRAWWAVTGTTILLAARERGSGITALDVARVAVHGDEKAQKKAALLISRMFRVANRTLGVRVKATPDQFVAKITTDLGMPREVESKARELLRLLPARQGGSPRVAAAGCVYVAARITGNRIGQRAVADVGHVSEVSLRAVMTRLIAAHPEIAEEMNR